MSISLEPCRKFTIENRGNGESTNVKATLNNWPSNVQALDGAVVFGTVAAGQKVTSADTFSLRIDRSKPVANTDLTWIVEYTDPGGNHWKLTNSPLFP
ncbi:MAG: hypothetical protein IT210_14840 [Armatimonadetes bacterium]|nr:hypothetical protein [Armatimonadota bacterium]